MSQMCLKCTLWFTLLCDLPPLVIPVASVLVRHTSDCFVLTLTQ